MLLPDVRVSQTFRLAFHKFTCHGFTLKQTYYVSLDSGSASLGEVEDLSSNASAMVKISALSAWADLRVACASQKFLIPVVHPHEVALNRLWVGALKDFALLRVDSDNATGSGGMGSVDLSQSGLGREVLLPVSLLILEVYVPYD